MEINGIRLDPKGKKYIQVPHTLVSGQCEHVQDPQMQLVLMKHLEKLREEGHDQSPGAAWGFYLFTVQFHMCFFTKPEVLHTAVLIPNSLRVIVGIWRSRFAGGLLIGGVA